MIRTRPRITSGSHPVFSAANSDFFKSGSSQPRLGALFLLFLTCVRVLAADSTNTNAAAPAAAVATVFTNDSRQFSITSYRITGDPFLTSNSFAAVLERHTGTNVDLVKLVAAASDLERTYRGAGYTNVTIALVPERITNGLVTMHVFRGARPQLLVDGRRVEEITETNALTAAAAAAPPGSTNAASTNAVPKIYVRAYEITGDTLLSTKALMEILAKYTGTNMTVADILKAANELQMEYRNRGYPTVSVTLPKQKLDTNGIVKIRVFEGTLANINVVGNRFFSSNNVMRALPSLRTNIILSRPIFEAELDRANANQDRQIYPTIEPGPVENTSDLTLKVEDRFPLHAKVDFNNQNSPGTPDLRINSSAVYNNLWQLEHSVGVQYSFSPGDNKTGDWNFYDRPLVANYGGFYRIPLGGMGSVEETVETAPGSFGYDEATRKFNLPPPSGRTELNIYASRSTIDTGLETLSSRQIANITNAIRITEQDVQDDLTINNDIGANLTFPVLSTAKTQSSFSLGLDYKQYELDSNKTNNFIVVTVIRNSSNIPIATNTSVVANKVPTTVKNLNYLPFSMHFSLSESDKLGSTALGLGVGGNFWFSGTVSNLQNITGSTESTGYWVTLLPSVGRDFTFAKDWTLSLTASGQVASEPLVNNEQFGVGGVNSIRGYHEGEVFGNDGWWFTAEQKTPGYVVGTAYGKSPLVVRGSVYMGYGQAFVPQMQQDLWGVGFGAAASIGANWEARFLFSWPLISTSSTTAGQGRFDFGLSAQF